MPTEVRILLLPLTDDDDNRLLPALVGSRWATSSPKLPVSKEAQIAYIEQRRNGWLVVWRDASKNGAKEPGLFRWSDGKPDPVDPAFFVTKEQARSQAEHLCDNKRQLERAYRKAA